VVSIVILNFSIRNLKHSTSWKFLNFLFFSLNFYSNFLIQSIFKLFLVPKISKDKQALCITIKFSHFNEENFQKKSNSTLINASLYLKWENYFVIFSIIKEPIKETIKVFACLNIIKKNFSFVLLNFFFLFFYCHPLFSSFSFFLCFCFTILLST
jgi:hypothetical protein